MIARLTSLRRQWPELKSGETHLVHDHPVAVIEMGRLLLLCNPTGDEHRVRVPGGERGILLDTSNLDTSGKVGGELTVPSWSALLLGPAS